MSRLIFVVTLFALLLSACGNSQPAPTPTATSLPTDTPIPTATATVTATPIPTIDVGGIQVPDPNISNPELFDTQGSNSPIGQFVNAMSKAGINVGSQEVIDELRKNYRMIHGVDGRTYILTTYTATDQNGSPYTMGLIAKQGGNEQWGWENLSIKDLVDLGNTKSMAYCFWQKLSDKKYVNFYLNNFNEMRIGWELRNDTIFNDGFDWNKVLYNWDDVQSELNQGSILYENEIFNQVWLSRTNSLIKLAQNNNMKIVGEAFFWVHDIPSFMNSSQYSAEGKRRIFEFMVKSKLNKFKDIDYWVAFSEMGAAELWGPTDFKNLYNELGGRAFLENIIQWIKEVNPNVKLIAVEAQLLDANNEPMIQSKQRFDQILKDLERMGSTVNAVESEDNLWIYAPPNLKNARSILDTYKNNGYEIFPPEMIITTSTTYPIWSGRPKTVNSINNPLLAQLDIATSMSKLYLDYNVGVGLFSGTDDITWIHDLGYGQETPELLTYANYSAKPELFLIQGILLQKLLR